MPRSRSPRILDQVADRRLEHQRDQPVVVEVVADHHDRAPAAPAAPRRRPGASPDRRPPAPRPRCRPAAPRACSTARPAAPSARSTTGARPPSRLTQIARRGLMRRTRRVAREHGRGDGPLRGHPGYDRAASHGGSSPIRRPLDPAAADPAPDRARRSHLAAGADGRRHRRGRTRPRRGHEQPAGARCRRARRAHARARRERGRGAARRRRHRRQARRSQRPHARSRAGTRSTSRTRRCASSSSPSATRSPRACGSRRRSPSGRPEALERRSSRVQADAPALAIERRRGVAVAARPGRPRRRGARSPARRPRRRSRCSPHVRRARRARARRRRRLGARRRAPPRRADATTAHPRRSPRPPRSSSIAPATPPRRSRCAGRALAHFPGAGEHALGWLRTLDVAIDAAAALDDARRFELLDKRAELVAALPGGALEALATRHAIASRARRATASTPTRPRCGRSSPTIRRRRVPGAGRRIALLRAGWSAAARRRSRRAAIALAAHRQLADSECAEVAATHAWRALELAAGARRSARSAISRTRSPMPPTARPPSAGSIELELAAPSAGDDRALRGPRRPRAALGRRDRRAPRRSRRRRSSCGAAPPMRPGARRRRAITSCACHRGGDEDDARRARTRVGARASPSRAAPRRCGARAASSISSRGDFVEAEESLQRAADLAPEDPFCRAALAAVYRAGKRYDQLAQVLAELSTSLTSREARAAAAREYAELLDEHLGDPARRARRARAHDRRAPRRRRRDARAREALRSRSAVGALDRAAQARRRARAARRSARAEIWIEIARARGAPRRSPRPRSPRSSAPPRPAHAPTRCASRRASTAQAGHLERALAIVRAELADRSAARAPHAAPDRARAAAHRARPRARGRRRRVPRRAQHRARSDRGARRHRGARARKLGLWDELARAFRGAPQTPRNLEVLAEALAKIAEWSELAEVRRRQLEAATTPDEKAQRAERARAALRARARRHRRARSACC